MMKINQTKISKSSAKFQHTSSSSIKASNIPTEIVSSDSNESGKEQTSKILESSAKLQNTSSSSIKASNKPTKIVSSDSNESGKKEQTSKKSELNTKLQDTSSLFIKDSRNKPTRFVSFDDESGKKDHQLSKKKFKIPEKLKKSSSIKASNKSTEVVSSNDENNVGHQPKKNSKNSKKKSKSKNSERTSGLETDSSPAAPRKVTYHSLTELLKDIKDNLRCHCHQREDLLKKEKSESERTEEIKRKHGNSRQSKLKKSELNPIMLKNVYHSPEESEVDSDNNSNENCIVIQDIKWRIANIFKRLFGHIILSANS
ncbi:hypothetical protein C1646_775789 [Rhizophagus diaphanus]|nr:hypothetical protein C1646_775789 [Rhizophagus diaphanus] [Rhizophagus sp. MUCL 43196]